MQASRRRFFTALAGIAASAFPGLACSEEPYPSRPIRIVLPNTIGGGSDLVARLVTPALSEALGQPIVIDARPGAAGRIAIDHVLQSQADGYTLLLANNGTHAILTAGREGSGASASALVPVTMLARAPLVIAVNRRLDCGSLQALIDRARREPHCIPYASSGNGSTSHLAATLLARRAGIELQHVPYAGTAAAVRDVLSGEVPIVFTQMGTIASLVRGGQLQALAVTGERRLAQFPDLTTVAEAGYPGFEISTWYGIVVPPATPRAIVLRLHQAFTRALGAPDVRRQLAALGMEAVGDSPEAFAKTIDHDVARWADLMREHGIEKP